MSVLSSKLLNDAMSLPNEMRAEIVEKLIESLNIPVQKEIDKLWTHESEKRLKEIKSGRVKTIPGNVVFSRIKRAAFAK